MRAAVGVKAGATVTLGGDVRRPDILDRRFIEVREGEPYHLAATKPIATARKIVERAAAEHRRRAIDGLKLLTTEIHAAGVVLGNFAIPDSLETILRSHVLCHAAEGELVRDAFLDAFDALGLPVTAIPEKELKAHVPVPPDDIDAHLAALGKVAGPPWRKDHRHAATIAWIALAS